MVTRCAETYLKFLPQSTRLMVMLGTGDGYTKRCRQMTKGLYGSAFVSINAVAYCTGSVTWVYASHPSGLNGYHPAWMVGDPATKQGHKRRLAMEAARAAGFQPSAPNP